MNDQAIAAPAAGHGPWIDRYVADGPGQGQAAARFIDMATVRGFLWRQRFVLIGVTAAALLIAFLLTLLATPIYQATASVRVDPEQRDIFDGDSLEPTIQINALEGYLATIARVVSTRTLAEQVVDALKLDQRADFLGLAAADRPEGVSDTAWARQRREMAVGALMSNVKAEAPLGQRVVEVSFRSPDQQMAATVANAYADNLLTDDLRRSLQKNAYAQRYLNEQVTEVRGRLDDAQRRALGYARANGIIGESLLPSDSEDSGSAPQTITAVNLGTINAQLSAARARRIEAEQAYRSVAGSAVTDMPAFVSSGAGQALIGQRAQIEGQLAEVRQRYGPDYPQVGELQAQLSAVNRQIGQFGSSLKASLRKDYDAALGQERALGSELSRISGDTLDEQDRRVAFNQLNAEAQALQTQLDALLERYNQIAASANVTPSTMTLLDRATVPGGPVSPNLFNNLLVGLILGGGLALGLAVMRETLDDRLRSEEDVESKLGIPLLGVTPLIDKGEDVSESMALAEAHSSIRAAIDFGLTKTDHNVIMLTSSQSVEGKTTTAVAIAREYARLGRRVLLIDADLRRPSVSGRFGFKRPASGFAEVLSGSIDFRSALLTSPAPNLDVMPVGSIPPNPVEIISSPRVDEFFAQYREIYDLIVVDCPPIVGLADSPLLSRVADGVIFVVESNRAHFGQAKTALRRLRDAGAPMLGVVLTKFRALDAGYNYDYNYSYYTYGEKAKKD